MRGESGWHVVDDGGIQGQLNWVELGDTCRHALTVAKMRAMPTSRTTHECETVNGLGMKVLPRPLRAALPMAPFAGYLGLLSRAPERRTP